MTAFNLPETMRLVHSEREGLVTVWEGVGGMRMFDHSPWGGVSVTRTPESVNQEFCQHVWGNQPTAVRVEPDGYEPSRLPIFGKAFKCTMCQAYLVLHERAG